MLTLFLPPGENKFSKARTSDTALIHLSIIWRNFENINRAAVG